MVSTNCEITIQGVEIQYLQNPIITDILVPYLSSVESSMVVWEHLSIGRYYPDKIKTSSTKLCVGPDVLGYEDKAEGSTLPLPTRHLGRDISIHQSLIRTMTDFVWSKHRLRNRNSMQDCIFVLLDNNVKAWKRAKVMTLFFVKSSLRPEKLRSNVSVFILFDR